MCIDSDTAGWDESHLFARKGIVEITWKTRFSHIYLKYLIISYGGTFKIIFTIPKTTTDRPPVADNNIILNYYYTR